MAHTSRGIWYPSTSDTVRPASRDFKDMALTTNAAIDTAVHEASPYNGEIPDQGNLNDYVTSGWWRRRRSFTVDTIANVPADMPRSPFRLEVFNISDTIKHQVITTALGGHIYSWVRYKLGETWHSWHKKYDSEFGGDPHESGSIVRTSLQLYGDSQVEGAAYTSGFTNVLEHTSIANRGRSGDTSDEVTLRAGVKPMTFTVPSGAIPASGGVTVETNVPMDTNRERLYGGTLAGIVGTLRHYGDGTWWFTRASSGSTTPINEPELFHSNQSYLSRVIVAQFGGNNTKNAAEYRVPRAQHIKAAYQQFYDTVPHPKHILFAGITYGGDSQSGDARYEIGNEVNEWLSTTYPKNFYNINHWLIEHGMDAAGLTDTQADIDARAAGLMPPSLLFDNVHFKPEVRTAVGEELAKELQRRGWVD